MPNQSLKIAREAAPIRTQTLQKLREAIVEGYFKPGERLYEKELCERLGVSRTSIREALRQLESEGLVSTVPNQGPIVTKVSLEEAEDIYEVRELLECLAVRLFSERATDEEVARLTSAVDELDRSFRDDDIKEFLRVKTKFYEILFSGCGNRIAHSVFRSLVARVNFLRKTSLSQPSRPQESVSEIKGILEAIQKRDSQGAWERCSDHVRKASKVALQGLRREYAKQEAVGGSEE